MRKQKRCGGGNPNLPDCKVRGFTNVLPEVPDECRAAAAAEGKTLCVTHAGASVVNQAQNTLITTVINIPNARKFWAQLLVVSVFDTGLSAQVRNGFINDVVITGSSQFAGTTVSLAGFSSAMPFLGVAWDVATDTNPITVTWLARSAVGNVDAQISCVGYAIR